MDKKCLIKDCDNLSMVRGLCWNCYNSALWQIRKGRTNWRELTDNGLALPIKKNKGKFGEMFKDMKKG